MEIVKDFGEITLPRGWEEITLKQFSEISKIDDDMSAEDKFVRIVEILSGKDREFMNSLPYDFIQSIWLHLSFLEREPQYGEPKASIEIGKDVYRINVEEKLKFGEWTDFSMILKDNPTGYAQMLGVLCRKDGEVYDSQFINEVLPKRIEMFEELSVLDLMPVIAFFLQLSITFIQSSDIYTKVKELKESIVKSITDSMQDGDSKGHSTTWQGMTLRKLNKFDNLISKILSNTSLTKRERVWLKRLMTSGESSRERQKAISDAIDMF